MYTHIFTYIDVTAVWRERELQRARYQRNMCCRFCVYACSPTYDII